MRVIVPYAPGRLHPRVMPSLWSQGFEVEAIECVNTVDHADSYPLILRRELLSGDDVCIIEHDVESRPGFLADLDSCPEPWCFFAYDFRVSWEDAVSQPTADSAPLGVSFAPLGHTRFRAGVGEKIEAMLNSSIFRATWVARDVHLAMALTEAGFVAHRHTGKAFHHHDYSGPGVPDDLSPMDESP